MSCTTSRFFGTTGVQWKTLRSAVQIVGPVNPFGTMQHWFALDEGGALCLACVRALVPERVEIAEAWEKRWNETTENPPE
jgi:hypothetical protein